MTRRLFRISLAASALFVLGSAGLAGQSRQTMGEAFDKTYKPEKKPTPGPNEFTPEERKRLMDEVSAGFYAEGLRAKSAGKLVEAQALFERVLTLDPTNQPAKSQLADIRKKTEITKATKAPSKDGTAKLLAKLWSEADADARAGRWDDAQLGYRKILAAEPGNRKAKAKLVNAEARLFETFKKRGDDREQAGDLEGALDAFRLALVHGDDGTLVGRMERLRQRLAESKRRRSDETYASALSASQQGNNEKARVLCREALKIDPSNIQAQRMLERLERRVR